MLTYLKKYGASGKAEFLLIKITFQYSFASQES
jgi:hypothetical protein